MNQGRLVRGLAESQS